jgi:hypothetical protein
MPATESRSPCGRTRVVAPGNDGQDPPDLTLDDLLVLTAASSSATPSTTSAAGLPCAESARAAPRSREAEDPAAALLGWQGAPRSLEALAAGPRGQPGTSARRAQAPELPGQTGGRQTLNRKRDSFGSSGRRQAPRSALGNRPRLDASGHRPTCAFPAWRGNFGWRPRPKLSRRKLSAAVISPTLGVRWASVSGLQE